VLSSYQARESGPLSSPRKAIAAGLPVPGFISPPLNLAIVVSRGLGLMLVIGREGDLLPVKRLALTSE
jgi:hypothetical protein